MGVDIKIVEDHFTDVQKAFPEAVDRILEAIGIQATSYAKQNLNSDPVRIDTGLLVNSIAWARSGEKPNISEYSADKPRSPEKPIETGSYSGQAPSDANDKKAVYIGSNVEYANYVHDGTSKMTANRFLKNAVVKNKDTFKAIAESELKKT